MRLFLLKKGGIIMKISADSSNLIVGEVKSRTNGKLKPVILIKSYKDLPSDIVSVTLPDGTKIMTEPIITKITSLQLYLESEKAIYMDQATWERTNG